MLAENPLPPLLETVTVNHEHSSATLRWAPSLSAGVTGYVVYRYRNGEGYAIDTLRNSDITTFTDYGTGALFFSESYVVAALAADDNISPLSNAVSTIYLSAITDTCNLTITLSWNQFLPGHSEVTDYELLFSNNGAAFTPLITTDADETNFIFSGFEINYQYRFMIKAILASDQNSHSNMVTLVTDIQRPPEWIEARYITTSGDQGLEMEIAYDTAAETDLFRIERRDFTGIDFQTAVNLRSSGGTLIYHDRDADIRRRYIYRVSAINNCNTPVVTSGEFGNIVLENRRDAVSLELIWNRYSGWSEGVERYELLWGGASEQLAIILTVSHPDDTLILLDYSDIMYNVTDGRVCFGIRAIKEATLYEASSLSNSLCIDAIERVTLPTAFTPNSTDINSRFKPVLSFTPQSYSLVIRTGGGRIVFQSDSHDHSWDGTYRGERVSPGVYLWFLRTTTPSGKSIEKRGTVALIYN